MSICMTTHFLKMEKICEKYMFGEIGLGKKTERVKFFFKIFSSKKNTYVRALGNKICEQKGTMYMLFTVLQCNFIHI